MIRPFVTPPSETNVIPYIQRKLDLLEPVRKTMMQVVDRLVTNNKDFEYHLITEPHPSYGLYINRLTGRANEIAPFPPENQLRWQFVFSSKEDSLGAILHVVYNRTGNVIESGFYRKKGKVRRYEDLDDAQFVIQTRIWLGLFKLMHERIEKTAIQQVSHEKPSSPQISSLYGPLPPIVLLDEIAITLRLRESFFL